MSRIHFTPHPHALEVFSPELDRLLLDLHDAFQRPRAELLAARADRQRRIERGESPGELAETAMIRKGEWKITRPFEAEFAEFRKVPAHRFGLVSESSPKLEGIILDFEDALTSSWRLILTGHLYAKRFSGWIRPRALHQEERDFQVDGRPMSAALFDLAVSLFSHLHSSRDAEAMPFPVIPKMEGFLEARWWNDVLHFLEDRFSRPRDSLRVALEIETLHAGYEVQEIAFEMKDRVCLLHFDSVDYAWSVIKKLSARAESGDANRSSADFAPHAIRALKELSEARALPLCGDFRREAALPRAVTSEEVRAKIAFSLRYLQRWLGGQAEVEFSHFELARSLLWQWLRFEVPLENGDAFDLDLYQRWKEEELAQALQAQVGEAAAFSEAGRILDGLLMNASFTEFSGGLAQSHLETVPAAG